MLTNQPPPSLSLSPAPLVELERVSPVSESAGSGSVCVVLHSSSPPRAVSLSLTVDGTTGPSLSFSATSQASARQCVSVTITDDALVENDETIPVELVYSGSGLITILPSSVSISVIDDDSEYTTLPHTPHSKSITGIEWKMSTMCGGS